MKTRRQFNASFEVRNFTTEQLSRLSNELGFSPNGTREELLLKLAVADYLILRAVAFRLFSSLA